MSKTLKKSLYLGLSALSFSIISANVLARADNKNTNVSATYSGMYTDRGNSNVLVNANNAIYTKPGTLKGAKLVASRDDLSDLTISNSDKNTFFVYQMAKTNRGSYYAKVVTMDKRYRGWIYAGKQDFSMNINNIGGGVKSVNTLTNTTLPEVKTGYKLKNSRLWTAPYHTNIDAKMVNLSNTNYSNNDTFTIDQAAYNRSGWLYYHVYDANNPSIQGWVYYTALNADSVSAATGYTLNFSTDYGNTIRFSKVLSFQQLGASDNTPANLNMYNSNITNLVPAGYHIDAARPFTTNDDSKNLTKGGQATVNLVPNNIINLNIYDNNSGLIVNDNARLNNDFNDYFNLNTLNNDNSYRYLSSDNLYNFINAEINKNVISLKYGYNFNKVNDGVSVAYNYGNINVYTTTNKSVTNNY
ncbi:hypothetical protein [Apilactobacillus xinyiensis]|uniref:hypothetical protein n=1 Tax=Apilactobacillus xinyiensis TaxID=2841032 RepID=UPI001C7CB177|nr:hypothetical protein [Apilactobacillus xinyiensis]